LYNTVRSPRLYEQIVEQIIKLIKNGDLVKGDRLPAERELAEQFGVSRTAVREAIKALRERGLIDVQPGRGTFINDPSQSATDVMRDSISLMVNKAGQNSTPDLIQVRALFEPEVAALAAENATDQELDALQQIVSQMDHLIQDEDGFIEADQEFHSMLAEATHNSLILVLLQPIVELLQAQRRRIFNARNGAERGQTHHRAILQAILNRDPSGARQAMREHIKQVTEDSQSVDLFLYRRESGPE